MTRFQRTMALLCFLGIGFTIWAAVIFLLDALPGKQTLGFFFGILWWELGLAVWPKQRAIPLMESAVAWKVPVITRLDEAKKEV